MSCAGESKRRSSLCPARGAWYAFRVKTIENAVLLVIARGGRGAMLAPASGSYHLAALRAGGVDSCGLFLLYRSFRVADSAPVCMYLEQRADQLGMINSIDATSGFARSRVQRLQFAR